MTMNKKIENFKYRFFIGFGIACSCITTAYMTYFLTEKGLTDYSAGIVIAASFLASTILSPLFGRIADKSNFLKPKTIIILFMIIQVIVSIILMTINNKYTIAVSYFFLALNINIVIPIAYAITFKYKNYNIEINFGVARGFGSLFYGLTSFALGYLSDMYSCDVIPIASIILSVATLIISFRLLPVEKIFELKEIKKPHLHFSCKSIMGFIKKYPYFLSILVGITFLMTFHTIISMYMIRIVEKVGCNTNDLGLVIGIAAISEIPIMFLYARLRKHFKDTTLLIVSGFSFVIKAGLLCVAQDIILIYIAQLFQMTSYGLMANARVYFASEVVEKKDMVTGQTLTCVCDTISSILGSYIGGFLITFSGNINSTLYFGLFSATIGTVIVIFAVWWKSKINERRNS